MKVYLSYSSTVDKTYIILLSTHRLRTKIEKSARTQIVFKHCRHQNIENREASCLVLNWGILKHKLVGSIKSSSLWVIHEWNNKSWARLIELFLNHNLQMMSKYFCHLRRKQTTAMGEFNVEHVGIALDM